MRWTAWKPRGSSRQAHPDTLVILISTYTEADMPAEARSCGAAAYVNKDELSPRVVRRLWEAGGDPGMAGSLRVIVGGHAKDVSRAGHGLGWWCRRQRC